MSALSNSSTADRSIATPVTTRQPPAAIVVGTLRPTALRSIIGRLTLKCSGRTESWRACTGASVHRCHVSLAIGSRLTDNLCHESRTSHPAVPGLLPDGMVGHSLSVGDWSALLLRSNGGVCQQ